MMIKFEKFPQEVQLPPFRNHCTRSTQQTHKPLNHCMRSTQQTHKPLNHCTRSTQQIHKPLTCTNKDKIFLSSGIPRTRPSGRFRAVHRDHATLPGTRRPDRCRAHETAHLRRHKRNQRLNN